MDKKLEIQLGIFKNANSINVDNYDKFELSNRRNKLLEYDIRNVLSVTEVFEAERQANAIYRVYGGIEWISTLNGISTQYKDLEDFFIYGNCTQFTTCNYKNIFDSFDFYLVRPSSGYTKLTSDEISYVRNFEVVATPNEFELFNAGFSSNVYGDTKYTFIFKKDFDITSLVDEFGFPITELYLHPRYNKSTNGDGQSENTYRYVWSTSTGNKSIQPYSFSNLEIGDNVYGDKIQYSKSQFLQVEDEPQMYFIETPYDKKSNQPTKYIRWKYNPLIPLKLRYFSNELKRANTGGTAYDQVSDIPYYATDLGDGNVVWREILEQGYIDPLTGDGVDYPFVNKKRYLFSNIILDVVPDLDDTNTQNVFREINFADPTSINLNPTGDLNNIGKPCQ